MKRKASEGYPLIPEGEQIIRIKEVDESQYTKFQKITVTVEDASGATARMNFNFVKDDGSPNEVADGIFTRLGRAALDDQTLDEIDSADLAGNFVRVEIEHNEGTKGGTFANVKKILGHAEGFPAGAKTKPRATAKESGIAETTPAHKKTAAEILAEARARRIAAQK